MAVTGGEVAERQVFIPVVRVCNQTCCRLGRQVGVGGRGRGGWTGGPAAAFALEG